MLKERKYVRFNALKGTRALACNKIAHVIDISKGGFSLMVLDDTVNTITGEHSFDLLCNEKGLDARQLPGKVVWNKEVSYSSTPGMVYKKIGVQFGKLSNTQQRLLDGLLFNCHSRAA